MNINALIFDLSKGVSAGVSECYQRIEVNSSDFWCPMGELLNLEFGILEENSLNFHLPSD